jgi:hypothetical protein
MRRIRSKHDQILQGAKTHLGRGETKNFVCPNLFQPKINRIEYMCMELMDILRALSFNQACLKTFFRAEDDDE